MEVGDNQLELIAKAKKYLKKSFSENINVHSSGVCYFCSFGLTPGYAKLKLWNEGFKSIFYSFKIFFKDTLSISNLYNYYVANELKFNNKHDNIIISWAKKNDFLSEGSYFDRYVKINSRNLSNTIWFLIYEDKILPEKIDNNILIFVKSQKEFKYNFFFLLKYISKNIISSKFSPKKIFHKISSYTAFSSMVSNEIKKFINDNTKTVIMPYEGQPFQNTIFKTCKKINSKIKTIGYVHSFPIGLPTNFICRDGSPEKLIINGSDQYHCFKNHLNWKNNQLKILPSTRFITSSENMSGYIYLPITLQSTDKIIESLENFILQNKKKTIPNLVVKNHPFAKNSKIHLKITKQINKLLLKHSNLFSSENNVGNISVFVGATGSIIEALERGVQVIHICEDPIFQGYSSKLWPSIEVMKINNNTFEYKLLKKGNLIQFGNNNNIFEKNYIN